MDAETPAGQDEVVLDRFEPLRPASRTRVILGLVIGTATWIALLELAHGFRVHFDVIEVGLAIAAGSFVVAALVLGLLRLGRRREERRYAADR